jgi:hypothetical protein
LLHALEKRRKPKLFAYVDYLSTSPASGGENRDTFYSSYHIFCNIFVAKTAGSRISNNVKKIFEKK